MLPGLIKADIPAPPPPPPPPPRQPSYFQLRGLAAAPGYALYLRVDGKPDEPMSEHTTYLIPKFERNVVCLEVVAKHLTTGRKSILRTYCNLDYNGQRFWLTIKGLEKNKIITSEEVMSSAKSLKSQGPGLFKLNDGPGQGPAVGLLLLVSAASLLLLSRYRAFSLPPGLQPNE